MYEHLQELMNSKGMRIADLARATGISYSTFTDWKAGRCVPKYEKTKKIADYFGVSVDYLLSEKSGTSPDAVQKTAQPVWYTDPDAAKLAEHYFTDPAYKVLFDAAQDSTPEDLQLAAEMLKRLKESRGD